MQGRARSARSWTARARRYALASLVVLSAAPGAPPAFAAGAGALAPSALPVTATAPREAASSAARTDPALLKLTSEAPVPVMIRLDYAPTASYTGNVAGFRATSPAVTGRRIASSSRAVRRYARYQRRIESTTVAALRQIPGFHLGRSLRTVYGGISATVPGDRIATVLATAGVVSIQRDSIRHLETDSSNLFIGSPVLWSQLHAAPSDAGKGVLLGDLDSGAWPEHPMLADRGNLAAPPPKADGTARVCEFGADPTSTSTTPFRCNHKLISGEPFLDTYQAVVGGETFASARDSDGHGTHTATTAAGDRVEHAPIFGIDRGPVGGVAPGAWVAVYKVCGRTGCFASDSVAAVGQAILDGVDVINFSISGGTSPSTDPVELAFLDAYAAGVFVSASAGNDGPTPGTTEHQGPWVTTVGASTLDRSFNSSINVTSNGMSRRAYGVSIGVGISTPTPIVNAGAAPYSDPYCQTEAQTGLLAGKVVICLRGGPGAVGRVQKGFNVAHGGAAGMVLVNPVPEDVETDNHFLPTIHLDAASGQRIMAFVAGEPDAVVTMLPGTEGPGYGDVLAAFSSRGPGGTTLKPDLTAPGVQILAGDTPVPDNVDAGAPGQLFQAIAGTSMAAPHVAGSALLLGALHPTWDPGQIRSALMTTAATSVYREDLLTPADPFDVGAGRIELRRAGSPGLTISETAANFAAQAARPDAAAIDLNVPSFDAPVFPGIITAARRLRSVVGYAQTFSATATAPSGARITITPDRFTVPAYGTQKVWIYVSGPSLADGQHFGQIQIRPIAGTPGPVLHLPVAFDKVPGATTVAQSCSPTALRILAAPSSTTCSIHVENTGLETASVVAKTNMASKLAVTGVTGGAVQDAWNVAVWTGSLAPRQDVAPAITPFGGPEDRGYVDLVSTFGANPTPVGDEDVITLTTPPFVFAGHTYTTLGVTSDGYAVAGGTPSADFRPQRLPDPAPPNNVLAPFWTDLTGVGAPGISFGTYGDGDASWLVVQWNVDTYGTETDRARTFQLWIGLNGTEDVTYEYDPAHLPAAPADTTAGLTVGAENAGGTAGAQLPVGAAPTGDLRIASAPGGPGGSADYTVSARAIRAGTSLVHTSLRASNVRGWPTVDTPVVVSGP